MRTARHKNQLLRSVCGLLSSLPTRIHRASLLPLKLCCCFLVVFGVKANCVFWYWLYQSSPLVVVPVCYLASNSVCPNFKTPQTPQLYDNTVNCCEACFLIWMASKGFPCLFAPAASVPEPFCSYIWVYLHLYLYLSTSISHLGTHTAVYNIPVACIQSFNSVAAVENTFPRSCHLF